MCLILQQSSRPFPRSRALTRSRLSSLSPAKTLRNSLSFRGSPRFHPPVPFVPFRFPFPSTLNSLESSLSFAASPASLPLPPLGFPFRSAFPRLLSSCAFLSSVSFSRFGPLPRSGSFRTLSRASLDRIPNFSLPVNPFLKKILTFSEHFFGAPHLVNFFLLYIYILWTFRYVADTIFSENNSAGGF